MAVREALETVAAHDECVLDAAVAELGQHAHPELGALPAGGPHPQPSTSRSPSMFMPMAT